MKRHQPSLDVADDLRQAAKSPYHFSRPEMTAMLGRAAEEIELLRLALSDAMTRERDGPEGRT